MNPNTELHFTDLKRMADSPATYLYYLNNPTEETDAMLEGTVFDLFVMPRPFPEVAVWTGKVRRGKDWDAFKAENDEAVIVTQAIYDRARRMADALLNDKEAREVLGGGQHQRFMRWDVDGRAAAGTPDICGAVLADVKRTDSDPRKFYWHADRMGWDAQLAWYDYGMKASGLEEATRLSIIAVSPKEPHNVTVFDLSDQRIELGTRKWRSWFERLLVCEESDAWPGYSVGPYLWQAPDEYL